LRKIVLRYIGVFVIFNGILKG